MRALDLALPLGLPLMIGGMITWMVAAEIAKRWLRQNDPLYTEPSAVARFFIGGFFTAIGPVGSYARQRRERGESSAAATAFWAGIVLALGGAAVLIGLLVAGS